jgi:hypothetical protein
MKINCILQALLTNPAIKAGSNLSERHRSGDVVTSYSVLRRATLRVGRRGCERPLSQFLVANIGQL